MIFCYRCPNCNSSTEVHASVGKAPEKVACPTCPSYCSRDFGAEGKVAADGKLRMDEKYPYVSRVLPRNLPGCQTTADGKPIIESKRHEANVMAQHGYKRD